MATSQNKKIEETDSEDESSEDSRAEEILEQARKRYKLGADSWSKIYNAYKEDTKFLVGDQWPDDIKAARTAENRPVFVVNRLPQSVKQLVNDQKQNKPAIKLSPVDDNADPETAEIFQGLIRNIENNSNAGAAYTHGLSCAASGGIGFFEVRLDYASDTSFDVEPRICRIPDPLSVILDPFFKEPDGSDANWGFKACDYSKEDYNAEFGDSELAKTKDWSTFFEDYDGWVKDDSVRVTEYYTKEHEPIELVQLSDGQVYDAEELQAEGAQWPVDELGQPLKILNSRKSKKCVVKHYKINGIEILEETVFPGPYIPLIPVLGEEIYVEGERVLKSLIRDAKTSQQLLNFWISSEAEAIALAPKAPFIVAEGQIPPQYEMMWKTANQRSYPYLVARTYDDGGRQLPMPQRQFGEPPIQAITMARNNASDDIKQSTGYFDSAIGNQSNEKSGVAIQRRTAQSQTSSFHFIDNLNRAIRHGGVILTYVIPQTYDTEKVLRVTGETGQEKVVTINKTLEDGKRVDFSVGKYDVVVETGPSFATKRQEASQFMIDFIRTFPQIAPVVGDLVAKNQDWPGASAFEERIKNFAIKNGMLEDDQQKQNPIPQQVQAQLQQQAQMIEQLTQQANGMAEEIKLKKYEIEAKKEIELIKVERDYNLELLKMQGQAAHATMEAELNHISSLQAQSHALQMQDVQAQQQQQPQQAQAPLNQNQNFNQQMPPDQQQMQDQQQPLIEG